MELFTRNKRFPFAVTGVSVALILYFLAFLNAQSSIAAFVTLAIIAHILIMIATLLTLPEIIYLSKNPEAIFRKWQKTNESEHQRTRMSRALYDGVNLHTYREKFRYALFVGSHGERYFTTLKSCNCMDFQKRNLPCKHMYRLACEMGMPLDLLPDPTAGYDAQTPYVVDAPPPQNGLRECPRCGGYTPQYFSYCSFCAALFSDKPRISSFESKVNLNAARPPIIVTLNKPKTIYHLSICQYANPDNLEMPLLDAKACGIKPCRTCCTHDGWESEAQLNRYRSGL